MIDHDEYIDIITRESAAFVAAATQAGFGSPVPSCPDWDVAALVRHLGEVQWFWWHVVTDRPVSWEDVPEPEYPVDDGALLAWFGDQTRALVDALRTTAPDEERYTWTTDHTAGWISRRQAHEAAVHRWDAELAAGDPRPIDAELASDGIDEFLMWFLGPDETRPGGSVHLHCGDVAGEWTLHPIDGAGYDVRREHAKGACAIRGSANDILLALWRRRPLDTVDVVGDADLAAEFVAWPGLD